MFLKKYITDICQFKYLGNFIFCTHFKAIITINQLIFKNKGKLYLFIYLSYFIIYFTFTHRAVVCCFMT